MLWDLDTGESRQLARVLASSTLVFSPDGKTIAGVGMSGPDSPSRISLWDVAKGGDAIAETPLLPAPAIGITFTADGTQLISAVATEGHPVQFWDIDPETRALSLAKEFPAPPHKAMKLTLNQAGTHLAVAFAGGGGWIWDLSKSSESPSEVISDGGLFCFAFGPDDRLLATGGFFGHLRVVSSDAPREVIVSDQGGGLWNVVTDLVFDGDGRTLFASKTDGTITPWKLSGAKSTVPPVDYLRLFDLEEATGDLVWNDQNSKLSPPTATMSFSPIQNHYLSELNVETDLLNPWSACSRVPEQQQISRCRGPDVVDGTGSCDRFARETDQATCGTPHHFRIGEKASTAILSWRADFLKPIRICSPCDWHAAPSYSDGAKRTNF